VLNKKGLGRGLDALIPQPLSDSDSDLIASIDVRDLRPNPYQPRRTFNEEKLEELAQSIREHGIIQPLIVRKSAVKGYDIVAGERRFRAAQMAGLTLVPAVVREFSDIDLMEIAMIENLQREDLNPIETAEAYAKLIERCGMTQEQLSQRVGQSRSHIANMLRLLNLPDEVRGIVSRGTLSMGHARALLAIEDKTKLIELAKRTVLEDWSVRKLEAVIYEKPKAKNVSRETNTHQDKYFFKQYEDRFRSFLGTAVRIQPGKKRGKIEIEYFSKDDLDRILNLLVSKTKQDGA
jgi:ParB family transcriptional regulator, chromosome partitioning protein